MQDMDFTQPEPAQDSAPSAPYKPAASPCYDAAVAERLFRAGGRIERISAGQALFAEDDDAKGGFFSRRSANQMYFLCEGEVTITRAGKLLDSVGAGGPGGRQGGAAAGDRTIERVDPRWVEAIARLDDSEIDRVTGRWIDLLDEELGTLPREEKPWIRQLAGELVAFCRAALRAPDILFAWSL